MRVSRTLAVAATGGALVVGAALSAGAVTAPTSLAPGIRVVGLTTSGGLTSIDTGRDKASRTKPIEGIKASEKVVGIDYRPFRGGKLYGLVLRANGSLRVIKISPRTGRVYSNRTLKDRQGKVVRTTGTTFGVDFDPVADRMRIVTTNGLNYRTDVTTGTSAVLPRLSYAPGDANAGKAPRVPAIAHSNSIDGATQSVLFDLDASGDRITRQETPNSGVLRTVGRTRLDVRGRTGFDIATVGGTDTALVSNTSGKQTKIYRVSLANGAVLQTSQITGKKIMDVAAPTGR